ncbi:uncharacterized protein VTP21DRAFT_10109 [Calcarisporiella thermophila]|uniref:uncharacterized protein n=1 Tax=Calcarisporiella thermophila TaxID=911321 RepID=UPI0037426035
MFGRIVHYAVDALLISTALAGIKRSTGLTAATSKIENKDVRSAVESYLNAGERAFDISVSFIGGSSYFERK